MQNLLINWAIKAQFFSPIINKFMFIEAELVFKSYVPLKLEKGMTFLSVLNGLTYAHKLDYVPLNEEEYIKYNGYL